MRKLIIITILSLFLTLLTSCYEPAVGNSVYYSNRGDHFVPIAYSMPVDSAYYGAKSARKTLPLHILETDEYGRVLCSLSFQFYSNEFFENGEAYCIVQKSSDSETSFYEDTCCAGVRNVEDAASVIAQLKQDNDWNCPLDAAKMTTLPYSGLDPVGIYAIEAKDEDNKKAALQFLGKDSYGCYFEIICKDAYGRIMITLSYPKENEVYLVILRDGEVLNGVVSVHKIVNLASPWEEIHELKQANNWNQPLNTGK